MFLAVAAVLVVLWLGGFVLNVVGTVVHVLLVLAVIAVVAHFFMGSRGRVT